MSLPENVSTCLLTYGPITDTFGNLADSITVEVVASRPLVHAASGRTLFDSPVTITVGAGESVEIPLPHTDQSGFRDLQQNSLTGWYYKIGLLARFGSGTTKADQKIAQFIVGQTEADADLLPSDGMVTPGVAAPIATVTSVQGRTGAVDLTDTFASLNEDGDLVIDGVPVGGSGGGVVSRPAGVHIPAGSLDRWATVRDNPDEFGEVPAYGDSTSSGEGAGEPVRSWIYSLRNIALAEGVADGGRGLIGNDDTAVRSGENMSGIVSLGNFGTGGGYDFCRLNTFKSTAAGPPMVVRGYGTKCRLHYGYTNESGDFTYSIDGGAPVTVHAYYPDSITTIKPLLLDLGADGLHTVTITNVGGRDLPGPTILIDEGNVAGAVPAGTYYWRTTLTTTTGETLPGPAVGPVTMSGSNGRQFFMGGMQEWQTIRLYRSTDPNTGFKLVKAATAEFNMRIVDDAASAGTTPAPTTSTAGIGGPSHVKVSPEFFRDTGVVFHKQAQSGSTAGEWFAIPADSAGDNGWATTISLGVTSGYPPAYTDGREPASNPIGARPLYRKPAMAIFAAGINNQQGITDEAAAVASVKAIQESVGEFVRMCVAAGVDALVVVPHYEYASQNWKYASRMRTAHWSAAVAAGAAVADFNIALGARNTGLAAWGAGPHINQAGYDHEAQWLWDNVLSPAAYPG